MAPLRPRLFLNLVLRLRTLTITISYHSFICRKIAAKCVRAYLASNAYIEDHWSVDDRA